MGFRFAVAAIGALAVSVPVKGQGAPDPKPQSASRVQVVNGTAHPEPVPVQGALSGSVQLANRTANPVPVRRPGGSTGSVAATDTTANPVPVVGFAPIAQTHTPLGVRPQRVQPAPGSSTNDVCTGDAAVAAGNQLVIEYAGAFCHTDPKLSGGGFADPMAAMLTVSEITDSPVCPTVGLSGYAIDAPLARSFEIE